MEAKFNIGDLVKIKSWETLVMEFGCDLYGDIMCQFNVTSIMYDELSKVGVFRVTDITDMCVYGHFTRWLVSPDILELADAEEHFFDDSEVFDKCIDGFTTMELDMKTIYCTFCHTPAYHCRLYEGNGKYSVQCDCIKCNASTDIKHFYSKDDVELSSIDWEWKVRK